MRYWIVLVLLGIVQLGISQSNAQEDPIYTVADEMPRFPACEQLEGTLQEKSDCANTELMRFVAANVVYPDSARLLGLEGKVVVRFVVEKNGSVSKAEVLRDIGGGCGDEVLRVINAMNEVPIPWVPGIKAGEPVRTYFNMAVPFKLQEPEPEPDFILFDGDSLWVKYDTPLAYEGGEEALTAFVKENTPYSESGEADCIIGEIEVNLMVRADASIKVLEVSDFSNLGVGFQFDAISTAKKTMGKWTPAVFQGRPVNANYLVRVPFIPESSGCAQKRQDFESAKTLIEEGITLYDAEDQNLAIEKFSAAIALFPDNAEYLALRAQAYLDSQMMDEACADLTKVKEIMLVSWYDQLLPFICK